jgi:hypothetical protein
MLARLSGKAAYAYAQAERIGAEAAGARDDALRKELLKLETSWLILAGSFEFAERISGFIEWSAQRVPMEVGHENRA